MATIDALRDLIYARDSGLCGICGQPVTREDMHMDHVAARSRGGADSVDNLRTAHALCNIRRGNGHDVIETTGYALRMPPELKAWLEVRAKENRRSLNSEIVFRLEQSREAEERRKR